MTTASRHILYIAYYFPPLGGPAAMRSLKNVKYLAQLGYQVQVLTVRPALIRFPKDPSLLKEIPAGVKVWRAFCPDATWLFKLLWGLKLNSLVRFIQHKVLIPDHEVLWLPFAKRILHRIVRHNPQISVAVISSGPPSSLSLGLLLKCRHRIPFICDFRDEWTNNPERINIDFPATTQSRELVMESRVLSAAGGISYLSQLMRDNFCRSYPFLENKPSAIIPNGFDDSDFEGLTASTDANVFRLVYCGSFYDRRQPSPLWQAILSLVEAKKLDPNKFRVDIYGRNTRSFVLDRFASNPVLERIVNLHPFLGYRDSLQELLRATALLLYIPSGKNTESVLTGKIFDYLRTGKPVLAIVPPAGLAAELLTKAGIGYIADHQDLPGIAERLMELYWLWENRALGELKVNHDYIAQFSRPNLARKLAKLIDAVATGQPAGLPVHTGAEQ